MQTRFDIIHVFFLQLHFEHNDYDLIYAGVYKLRVQTPANVYLNKI